MDNYNAIDLDNGLDSVETQSSPETVKSVRDFVTLFVKAIHTLALYPPTNPLPDQFRKEFYQAAKEILENKQTLILATTDRAFYYGSEIVYEEEPTETNPAYVLFRDGVREIGLLPALTAEEADGFLDTFVKATSRAGERCDMAIALWELGSPSIHYRTVDRVSDGELVRPPSAADYTRTFHLFTSTVELKGPEEQPVEVVEEENPHRYRGIQKDRYLEVSNIFRSSIELTKDDACQVKEMLTRDAECDCLLEAFKIYDEILHSETTPQTLIDVTEVTRRQFDDMVKRGNWSYIPQMLSNIHKWLVDFSEHAVLADRLRKMLYHAGEAQVLRQMAGYLNDNPQANLKPFREYLGFLDSVSLGAVTAVLGDLGHHAARKIVYNYLSERAEEAVDLVGNYVYDKRWFVVRNVALIMGRVNHPRAVIFLKKAAAHPDSRVRLEAVRSLGMLGSEDANELLLSFLDDPDPSLQIYACKALGEMFSTKVLGALEKRVSGPGLVNMEPRLQKELFAAYARTGGARSLPRLLSIINKKKLLGRSRWDKARINAALSAAARRVLEGLERKAANEAPDEQRTEQ